MHDPQRAARERRIAEMVRSACERAAIEAFEHAAISGLCHEGAAECAVGAIRALDLERLCRELDGTRDEGA